jgi:hypothetical protein
LRPAIGEQTGFTAHHVDESRRDHLAFDIQIGPPANIADIPNFRDRVTGDSNAAGSTRRPGAIANPAVSKNNIELRLASTGDEGNQQAGGQYAYHPPAHHAGFRIDVHDFESHQNFRLGCWPAFNIHPLSPAGFNPAQYRVSVIFRSP